MFAKTARQQTAVVCGRCARIVLRALDGVLPAGEAHVVEVGCGAGGASFELSKGVGKSLPRGRSHGSGRTRGTTHDMVHSTIFSWNDSRYHTLLHGSVLGSRLAGVYTHEGVFFVLLVEFKRGFARLSQGMRVIASAAVTRSAVCVC